VKFVAMTAETIWAFALETGRARWYSLDDHGRRVIRDQSLILAHKWRLVESSSRSTRTSGRGVNPGLRDEPASVHPCLQAVKNEGDRDIVSRSDFLPSRRPVLIGRKLYYPLPALTRKRARPLHMSRSLDGSGIRRV
jgi:hypothetical protein